MIARLVSDSRCLERKNHHRVKVGDQLIRSDHVGWSRRSYGVYRPAFIGIVSAIATASVKR